MSLISILEEAQLHREVYIAVLKGLLKTRGSKQALAQKVGITPQYLSYILDPYNIRVLHPQTAKAIVNALRLPKDQRDSLLEHMILSSERRLRAREMIEQEVSDDGIEERLKELRKFHQQATFGSDPSQAKALYRFVYQSSSALIRSMNPRKNPLAFVELCFLGHDSGCVSNRQVDALWFAKQAHFVMETILHDFSVLDSTIVDFNVNALRAEAVSYHNLGLYKEAYRACEQAEALLSKKGYRRRYEFWVPHLYRDKVNALAGIHRFAISEVEGLVHRVEDVCEKDIYRDEEKELLLFLIHSSLARAYITRGGKRNLRKASRLLIPEFEHMEGMGRIGPLHKVLLTRTLARSSWLQGDVEEWRYFIRIAADIAAASGLQHQVGEIYREYGRAVVPFLEETRIEISK